MALCHEINSAQIDTTLRIDAEFYQPYYFRLLNTLQTLGGLPLGQYAFSSSDRFQPVEGSSFQYIEISRVSLTTGAIQAITLPSDEAPSRAQYNVSTGDVLVSLVRPERNAIGLVTEDLDGAVCSSGFHVLKPISGLPSEYLFAYLKAKPIVDLLARRVTATMYPAVVEKDVLSLPFLIPDSDTMDYIVSRVKSAFSALKQSQTSYAEAEALLLEKLGFDTLNTTHELAYERSFSEVARAGRYDAEHFQPKYRRLLQAIADSSYENKSLAALVEPIRNGFDFREFESEGTPYIRVGDIKNGRIDLVGAMKIPIKSEDINKDVALQVGDVLFTRKGSYGNAAVVREAQKLAIISSEIMLLRPLNASILPDYLALYLNSQAGFQQVQSWVHGVAFYSIAQPDLGKIKIVLPPLEMQEQLTALAKQSEQAYYKSIELLEQAKAQVEEMILSGGHG